MQQDPVKVAVPSNQSSLSHQTPPYLNPPKQEPQKAHPQPQQQHIQEQQLEQDQQHKKSSKKWVPPHLRPGYKRANELNVAAPPPDPTYKSPNIKPINVSGRGSNRGVRGGSYNPRNRSNFSPSNDPLPPHGSHGTYGHDEFDNDRSPRGGGGYRPTGRGYYNRSNRSDLKNDWRQHEEQHNNQNDRDVRYYPDYNRGGRRGGRGTSRGGRGNRGGYRDNYQGQRYEDDLDNRNDLRSNNYDDYDPNDPDHPLRREYQAKQQEQQFDNNDVANYLDYPITGLQNNLTNGNFKSINQQSNGNLNNIVSNKNESNMSNMIYGDEPVAKPTIPPIINNKPKPKPIPNQNNSNINPQSSNNVKLNSSPAIPSHQNNQQWIDLDDDTTDNDNQSTYSRQTPLMQHTRMDIPPPNLPQHVNQRYNDRNDRNRQDPRDPRDQRDPRNPRRDRERVQRNDYYERSRGHPRMRGRGNRSVNTRGNRGNIRGRGGNTRGPPIRNQRYDESSPHQDPRHHNKQPQINMNVKVRGPELTYETLGNNSPGNDHTHGGHARRRRRKKRGINQPPPQQQQQQQQQQQHIQKNENGNATIIGTLNEMGKNGNRSNTQSQSQSQSQSHVMSTTPNRQQNRTRKRNQQYQQYNNNRSPNSQNKGNKNRDSPNKQTTGAVTLSASKKSTVPTQPGGWAAKLKSSQAAAAAKAAKRPNMGYGPVPPIVPIGLQPMPRQPINMPSQYHQQPQQYHQQHQEQHQQHQQRHQPSQAINQGPKPAKYQKSSLPPNLQPRRDRRPNTKNSENPFVTDAEKMGHVVEVLGVDPNDYQVHNGVSSMLTERQIHFENIICLKGRMFIVFDRPKTAYGALIACENGDYRLRRVDTNEKDVLLYKDIPPAKRPMTDPRVAERLINQHLGSQIPNRNRNNTNNNNNGPNRRLGASERDRQWRDGQKSQIREERQRKRELATQENTSWNM